MESFFAHHVSCRVVTHLFSLNNSRRFPYLSKHRKRLMHVPLWKTIEFCCANGFEPPLCWDVVRNLVHASTTTESVEDARKFYQAMRAVGTRKARRVPMLGPAQSSDQGAFGPNSGSSYAIMMIWYFQLLTKVCAYTVYLESSMPQAFLSLSS